MPKVHTPEVLELRRSYTRLSSNPPLSTWRITGLSIANRDSDAQAACLVQVLRDRGENCHYVASVHDKDKSGYSILVVIQHVTPSLVSKL